MGIGHDRERRDQLRRCGDLIYDVRHIHATLFHEVGLPDRGSYHGRRPLLERGDLALQIDTHHLRTLFVFERPVNHTVCRIGGQYFGRELDRCPYSSRESLLQVERSRFFEFALSYHFHRKGLRYRREGLGLNRNRSLLPLLNPFYLNLNRLAYKAVFVNLSLTGNRGNSPSCFYINLPREGGSGRI